ncbi:hypothetical protein ACOMHN_032879 [Nucella lapillus]
MKAEAEELSSHLATRYVASENTKKAVEDMWTYFKEHLKTVDKLVPTKTALPRHGLPWITPEAERIIYTHKRFYHRWKKQRSENLHSASAEA